MVQGRGPAQGVSSPHPTMLSELNQHRGQGARGRSRPGANGEADGSASTARRHAAAGSAGSMGKGEQARPSPVAAQVLGHLNPAVPFRMKGGAPHKGQEEPEGEWAAGLLVPPIPPLAPWLLLSFIGGPPHVSIPSFHSMKGIAAQSCSVGSHYQCSTQSNHRNQRTAGASSRHHISQGRHCHCASTPAPLLHLVLQLLLLLLLLLQPAGSLVGRHQQPALELEQRCGCASGLCVRWLLPLWQRRVSASAAGRASAGASAGNAGARLSQPSAASQFGRVGRTASREPRAGVCRGSAPGKGALYSPAEEVCGAVWKGRAALLAHIRVWAEQAL